ncbi:methyltransferase domain-containing protein [Streptomyces millisiae]|uniref:Protein-L-isoaspartate O-methyltransferase n=1 Tax=Streptomyces millisiae TaxID=3075542 RepID=A0ABU2LZN9_9ACTN|nr:methyltransferase domain-containing protein [Streptomyces sp. DSM 44918]MDT0323039.1 methyltransferase domain-containing protein [Streptomyces sp. DSM 44918]
MTTSAEESRRFFEARIRLARQLERSGVVLSGSLIEAFLNVPRHTFVPAFFRRDGETFRPWRPTDDDRDAWTAAVYGDDSLITELDGVHVEDAEAREMTGVPTSSSTAPSLMADMLDALDVSKGSRVLEVGTGSGYNAALLCWLAGAENVTTVDDSDRLASLARRRLASLGLQPRVLAADGAEGAPERAPFDRIIATCSVRRIPASWFEQCAPNGILVVPIKGTLAGGMIARLTKLPDGSAAGNIMHTPAAFMPLSSGPRPGVEIPPGENGVRRDSGLSGGVLDNWTFSFFAQLHMSASTVRTYESVAGTHLTTLFDAADGSVARVEDRRPGPGATVVTSGPRDLWAEIENAHGEWLRLNRPRREWFTITATPGKQVIGFRAPDGQVFQWTL